VGILTDAWGSERDEAHAAWVRHEAHIATIRAQLPPGALAFAEAPWHYDHEDHRCPHDAWVEHVLVSEPAGGSRRNRRRIDIEVRLLGAYHDGYLVLRYRNVVAYRVEQPNHAQDRLYRRWVGHGDWLTDDIGLSVDGFVTHDVVFQWGGTWRIECEELAHEWTPGVYGPEALDVDVDRPHVIGELPGAAT
jgi:hypothetical protein